MHNKQRRGEVGEAIIAMEIRWSKSSPRITLKRKLFKVEVVRPQQSEDMSVMEGNEENAR